MTRPRPGPAARISLPRPAMSPVLQRFLAAESGSAVLLLTATVTSLVWANLPGGAYTSFWATPIVLQVGHGSMALDLLGWVNEGAMSLFFLVVGLEISRELTVGELRNRRTLVTPALGALGGLLLPAVLYLAFAPSGPAAAGWGIPMSTDTAFLIGVLALFGPRCPDQLRLFLLTLAIVDDIGAITVMALFYTDDLSPAALAVAVASLGVLLLLRWVGVWRLAPYLSVGVALWAAVRASGVHPTLAGVLLGILMPAALVEPEQRERFRFYGKAAIELVDPGRARLAAAAVRATVPANDRLQNALHPISAYLVVPVFGLANAGVRLDGESLRAAAGSGVTLGVVVGLVVGNAVGISVATGLALRAGLGTLPGAVRYGHLIGGAVLAGIGFTISLFITDLAFTDEALRSQAKIGVLAGSLLAAGLGSLLLRVLGERFPLCTPGADGDLPPLPAGPWRAPVGAAGTAPERSS